ncbi:uncharacterized protein Tco025E_02050 [Trypanosoma conorhini]|uniref:RRM domain-containing protein n=1 Tax=Trypanosoma conorhini TaxID=83891 RepID=A0A3R7NQW0_9TRYP|nr:uncharacterized protein Tco025E_02050 [Trypanosoma conorhini]RNF25668.1 hypothetical protein Tco025E_02050 [Trypanosoma conorhini]
MWPKMRGPRAGHSSSSDGGRRGATYTAAVPSATTVTAASTTLLRARPKGHSEPCSPQLSSNLSLPPTRTIFIKNVPPTVDNSHKLLPFVPNEGLFSLRVKRTGGRDVGFAEYQTLESAQQAMQWFYRLEVTAGIAFNCFPQLLRSWTPIAPRFRYPVPYDEYNCCAADPARSTELLLNSVILMAEWSLSTPTYRPAFDSFVASSQPSSPEHYHDLAQTTMECAPQELFQASRVGFSSFPGHHHADPSADTELPQRAPRPHTAPRGVVFRTSGRGSTAEARGSGGRSETAAGCPLRGWEPAQETASTGCRRRESKTLCPQGQRGTGSSLARNTPFLSPDKVSQRGAWDSTLASAVLDDKDLPSSTLFLRVTGNGQRRRREVSPSSLSPGASFRREGDRIGAATRDSEASPCLQYRNRRKPRSQQGPQLRSLSPEGWSRFHHRHQKCCVRQIPLGGTPLTQQMTVATSLDDAVPPPASDKEDPVCSEFVVDEASISPVLLSPIDNSEGGDTEDAIVETILSCNFFSERFAGVRSYVPYSSRSGFLRFERSGDARRCLVWLRRQPNLAPVLSVQFAREDTRRRRRPHKARAE